MVEEYIRQAIIAFNKKAEEDPKLAREMQGIRRTVQIDVTDGESYNFLLDNARVSGLQKGRLENPDIRVIASTETFTQLKNGELRPMKALALKKLQVKASLEDMLRLRKFF
jgi:putative sterol carrier protein